MEYMTKKRTLRRLKIIKGQLAGLEKMIGADVYCVDLITQSSAVKQALSGVEDLILENHLSTHVVEQMAKGQREKAVTEILKVYKLSKRK